MIKLTKVKKSWKKAAANLLSSQMYLTATIFIIHTTYNNHKIFIIFITNSDIYLMGKK